jgi:large conductance mechanosensitive channel
MLALSTNSGSFAGSYTKMRGSKMGMMSDFKAFIARGNVLDLAVGVIIGAGFGKIVSSLTDDIIMPIVGAITGGVDFSSKYAVLSGTAPEGATLAAARAAGANVFAWGSFVILAFIIFMIVKQASKFFAMTSATAGPSEVDLLTEIRDSLKK